MKLLHTSDWHLGRSLYGKQRYQEFSDFLDWLLNIIEKEHIDLLLVAGDIFDTATPGTRAQALYYKFLCRVATGYCKDIIITSGNHDSPTFLSAPKEILQHLNITVVASVENLEDEIIDIVDKDGLLKAVVCGVPYLRDRDIRIVSTGESVEDKGLNLVNAVTMHYKEVSELARKRAGDRIPIIAMGHLFVTGGKTLADDGVRELYVGNLAHIGIEIFPDYLDYVALGHLHVPQKVGGSEYVRYSGSPISMGFGEATQNKKVIVVDLNQDQKIIQEIIVPKFQDLVRITGDNHQIISEITRLKNLGSDAWLEIEYKGTEIVPMLQADIEEALLDSSLEIRVIKNKFITNKTLENLDCIEELEHLEPEDIFNRCLDIYNISEEDRPILKQLHNEILDGFGEDLNED